MNILFACSEVAPFARTGGLADVCASLPTALAELGHNPILFLPAYRSVFTCGEPLEKTDIRFSVPVGQRAIFAELWKGTLKGTEIPIYFIRQDHYFDRLELYSENGTDYNDNCERFVFFSRAVMESMTALNLSIDILHSNDWQTGLIPAYQDILYRDKKGYEKIVTVHTIHNLAYQGIFWHWDMLLTGINWEHFTYDQMEFYGKLNLMKTAVMFAHGITTVSPRYALEIQSSVFGCGMESVLQYRSPMLRGILNGVSAKRWNPATDPYIVAPFDATTVFEKKPLCKQDLQTSLGLAVQADVPLVGVVSRFAYQKGIDLIAEAIPLWVEKHGVQFCLLGKGDASLETRLNELAKRYPQNVAVRCEFSDEWAHKIEAGSDIFLMPSRYEPCGLNQMYSQLYGTVPLVHDTGGLADTVVNLSDETLLNGTATGFSFYSDSMHDLNTTLWRTLSVYWNEKDVWKRLIHNGMRQNWSWQKSAEQYVRFYEKLRTKNKLT
ncbi:MAG: glycogen synthase GlgA [Planctomycetaceae bacterium]|jgi:starch synthase|nr:glycogen synthase GlgA [Planctomycetaceae bacterium]